MAHYESRTMSQSHAEALSSAFAVRPFLDSVALAGSKIGLLAHQIRFAIATNEITLSQRLSQSRRPIPEVAMTSTINSTQRKTNTTKKSSGILRFQERCKLIPAEDSICRISSSMLL